METIYLSLSVQVAVGTFSWNLQYVKYIIFFSRYMSLKCLCAQVISSNNLPFKGEVPQVLETFVQAHWSRLTRLVTCPITSRNEWHCKDKYIRLQLVLSFTTVQVHVHSVLLCTLCSLLCTQHVHCVHEKLLWINKPVFRQDQRIESSD